MKFRYVFSELGTGLKRNLSMTIAVIVTISVSLTLVAMGLLLRAQVSKAEDYWGSQLQITIFMCSPVSTGANCLGGNATPSQKQAVVDVLKSSPEVRSFRYQSKREAYNKAKEVYAGDSTSSQIFRNVKVSQMSEAYWVTLKNPNQFEGVVSQVEGLPGVNRVSDLRSILKPLYESLNYLKWGAIGVALLLIIAAVLLVSNTIRLAAFARRREIGIMRLVGASSMYIQLPFLLESVIAALAGVVIACGAVAALMWFVVYGHLRGNVHIVPWVEWTNAGQSFGWIAAIGLALAVIPTLVMTRKYLKV